MGTMGCVFCSKTGTPGNVNQHIRSFLDSARSNRTARLAAHHDLELVQSFYHLTASPQHDLVTETSVDRLAVLTAFASRLTKRLSSDAAADDWKERDFYARRGTWWAREVNTVLAMYQASGRIPELLAAHVANIVDKSITDSLRDLDRPDTAPPQPRIARSQVVTKAASTSALMPSAPRTEMTMQYSGSIHANDITFDNPRRMWINTIGDRNRSQNEREELAYVTISDDESPPPIRLSKRVAGSSTHRSASFAAASNAPTTAAPPASRSVSDSAVLLSRSGTPHEAANDTLDTEDMAPFLTLRVRGLTNKLATLPIAYGTTLQKALRMAVALAPAHVRMHSVPVAFEGECGEWEGEWPEWRWEQVMAEAERRCVVVEVRLVMV